MQQPQPPCADVPPAYVPGQPDPAVLAAVRAALLADPAQLDRLAAIPDRGDVLAALVQYAATQAIDLTAANLNMALRPDPLGLDRFTDRPVTGIRRPGRQWLPTAIASDGAQMVIDWAHYGAEPLSEPFFEAELRRARNRPVSTLLRWRTPLEALLEEPDLCPPPPLDGLIFHMSRCGSTLVAQALGAMAGNLVVSEAPPFDELLQLCQSRPDVPLDDKVALLRAMAGVLATDRDGSVQRRFLKTDCWHTGALPLLRAAFPDTPWIFLYRDPVEVLMSHEQMTGSQTLPGPHAALVGIDDPSAIPGLDFVARVLAATCDRAADCADVGGGLFVDYATLPGALTERILPHFGIVPGPDELDALTRAVGRDAKTPSRSFDPHERAPRERASAAVIAASERHLAAAVARVRALDAAIAD